MKSPLPPGVGSALLAACLFGVTTPLAKLLGSALPPFALAGLLYLAAGGGLLAFDRLRPAPGRIEPRALPYLGLSILAGGVAGPVLLMAGLARTSASDAALLLNLEGPLTALIAWGLFREHYGARLWAGMGLMALGGGCVAWSGGGDAGSLAGDALVVAASLGWALDNNASRELSAAPAARVVGYKGLAAGTVNLLVAFALGFVPPGGVPLAAAAAVGLIGYGLSLVLYLRALGLLGAARTAAWFGLAPFVGAGAALLLLAEPTGTLFWLGAALMAGGSLVHLVERHEHLHTHEPLRHTHAHRHDEHHRHAHDFPWDGREPHTHEHLHEPLTHSHPHYPDLHHRHGH